jgi:hypothetical protein
MVCRAEPFWVVMLGWVLAGCRGGRTHRAILGLSVVQDAPFLPALAVAGESLAMISRSRSSEWLGRLEARVCVEIDVKLFYVDGQTGGCPLRTTAG